MSTMRAVLVRVPRRALVLFAVVAAVGIGIGVWRLQSGTAAAPESPPVAKATRDDVILSVGGVGRIVEARASAQIALPTTAGGGAAGGASASADAVFPRTSGRVSRFLVAPGRRVTAGQALAMLDDGGAAAAAVTQAQNDLATAQLELEQKRSSDPLKGVPPTPAELAAARLAVTAAQERLARLPGAPRRADVSAAQLEVKRAEADLEAVNGGTPTAQAEAIRIAQRNVELAQQRLERTLAPPHAADVSAADAEVKKAEAELAALQKPAPPASPEAIAAAQQAVDAARLRLARAQAPADPADIAAAEVELRNAEAALAELVQPPLPERLAAAQKAVDAARLKLAKVQAPPNSADISSAQAEVKKAEAELAALQKPSPQPAPEAVAAAQQAVSAARLKRTRLLEPNPADVTAARLEVDRARAELRKLDSGPSSAARAAARQAVDSTRARLSQLLGPPLTTDVTAARLDVRRAEADLTLLLARGGPASPTDVALAGLKVEAAKARLDVARFAKRLLTVRAPSRGTVTALLTVPGVPVDTSTPIARVAELDRLAVSVDLSEFDVAQVKQGMKAVVNVDALGGKSFSGKVLFAALTGTDTGGIVTFPVKVGLARRGGLRPGMNVSVRIIVAQRRDVVQVPLEAVSGADSDEPTVTVVDADGKESERPVELGLANNKSVEIVKGLKAGEEVLLPETQGGGQEEA